MPTPAEIPLTPLEGLRARLQPGALLFALADETQAARLRRELGGDGVGWVGWSQCQALLRAWRPAAQERYSSMAGREAPGLRAWLAPLFARWQVQEGGLSRRLPDPVAAEEALRRCGLAALAGTPVSLLSLGETVRACLVGALAQTPQILVLQDLAEGLDAAGRALLLSLGSGLAGGGHAVLFLASRLSLLPFSVEGLERSLTPPPVGGAEIFRCDGLDLEAGERPLIRGLHWRIRGGEAWRLRGPNGQGKSSLLAYLAGEHPQAWARSWSLRGRERAFYTPLAALRREVAWVSPELAAAAGRPLSGLLESALASAASLLLLDEALRGLDSDALSAWQARLRQWLSPDKALVFVCHDPAEAPDFLNQSLELA